MAAAVEAVSVAIRSTVFGQLNFEQDRSLGVLSLLVGALPLLMRVIKFAFG